MFAYCNNNPVNSSDSLGLRPVSILERFGDNTIPVPPKRNNTKKEIPGKQNNQVNKNTLEEDVLQAKVAALYKGKIVIKVPGASAGFSCGIMFIGSNVSSIETVKHEYGHTKQLDSLGLPTYLNTVIVPSMICFALQEVNILPEKYYFSLPWERKADELGGSTDNYIPGSGMVSDIYWGFSKMISKVLRY